MKLNCRHEDLVYANDCHLMGESMNTIIKKAKALLVTSAPAGLPQNAEKTQYVSIYRQ